MRKSATILCLSRAMSPITHQLGTVGNESVLNTEPVRTPLGVRLVPMLSGNCLRHRMIRRPAAMTVVDEWGLSGTLTKDELNLLFHGGLRRLPGLGVSLKKIAEMERLFPMIRLLGACLPEDIHCGSLNARRAILVCRENAERIKRMVPAEYVCGDMDHLAPASSFVARWQYVRGEARKTIPAELPTNVAEIDADPKQQGSDMMPFAGTCVIAGGEFLHGFTVGMADEILMGCLFHSISRWDAEGATVGGQASRGHGVLATSYDSAGWDVEDCIGRYLDHIRAVKEEGIPMLKTMYAPPPKKAKQKKLVEEEVVE